MSDERQQDQPKSKKGKKKIQEGTVERVTKKTTNPNPDTSS